MFTGIVQHIGQVRGAADRGGGRRLGIDLGPLAEGLSLGASVAVAGVCLTAGALDGTTAEFDVVQATLTGTTLGDLRVGSKVNLERAVRADAALEGHIVQGHVDGTAAVQSVRRGDNWAVEFACATELTDAMAPHGSVAIDGVSLTLQTLSAGRFTVALVPVTLAETTLGELTAGDRVNVETDVIGKYVLRHLRAAAGAADNPPITIEMLRREGFA